MGKYLAIFSLGMAALGIVAAIQSKDDKQFALAVQAFLSSLATVAKIKELTPEAQAKIAELVAQIVDVVFDFVDKD